MDSWRVTRGLFVNWSAVLDTIFDEVCGHSKEGDLYLRVGRNGGSARL